MRGVLTEETEKPAQTNLRKIRLSRLLYLGGPVGSHGADPMGGRCGPSSEARRPGKVTSHSPSHTAPSPLRGLA